MRSIKFISKTKPKNIKPPLIGGLNGPCGGGGATALAAVGSATLIIRWFPELQWGQAFQLAIAKIIVFSILYFATIMGARNYRAEKHNEITNKHRENALKTFRAFTEATSDDQTKNAVLLRSTETIFSPASTGYIPHEGDHPGHPQILEIIRSVIGSSGQSPPQ